MALVLDILRGFYSTYKVCRKVKLDFDEVLDTTDKIETKNNSLREIVAGATPECWRIHSKFRDEVQEQIDETEEFILSVRARLKPFGKQFEKFFGSILATKSTTEHLCQQYNTAIDILKQILFKLHEKMRQDEEQYLKNEARFKGKVNEVKKLLISIHSLDEKEKKKNELEYIKRWNNNRKRLFKEKFETGSISLPASKNDEEKDGAVEEDPVNEFLVLIYDEMQTDTIKAEYLKTKKLLLILDALAIVKDSSELLDSGIQKLDSKKQSFKCKNLSTAQVDALYYFIAAQSEVDDDEQISIEEYIDLLGPLNDPEYDFLLRSYFPKTVPMKERISVIMPSMRDMKQGRNSIAKSTNSISTLMSEINSDLGAFQTQYISIDAFRELCGGIVSVDPFAMLLSRVLEVFEQMQDFSKGQPKGGETDIYTSCTRGLLLLLKEVSKGLLSMALWSLTENIKMKMEEKEKESRKCNLDSAVQKLLSELESVTTNLEKKIKANDPRLEASADGAEEELIVSGLSLVSKKFKRTNTVAKLLTAAVSLNLEGVLRLCTKYYDLVTANGVFVHMIISRHFQTKTEKAIDRIEKNLKLNFSKTNKQTTTICDMIDAVTATATSTNDNTEKINSYCLGSLSNSLESLKTYNKQQFNVRSVLEGSEAAQFWVEHFGLSAWEVEWIRFIRTVECVFGKMKPSRSNNLRELIVDRRGMVSCLRLRFHKHIFENFSYTMTRSSFDQSSLFGSSTPYEFPGIRESSTDSKYPLKYRPGFDTASSDDTGTTSVWSMYLNTKQKKTKSSRGRNTVY